MPLDKATVANIARLARIKVPDSDLETLAAELSQILDWIETLDELDTSEVAPMTHVAEMKLYMRDDVVTEGDLHDKVLANAPDQRQGFFAVPKVIE